MNIFCREILLFCCFVRKKRQREKERGTETRNANDRLISFSLTCKFIRFIFIAFVVVNLFVETGEKKTFSSSFSSPQFFLSICQINFFAHHPKYSFNFASVLLRLVHIKPKSNVNFYFRFFRSGANGRIGESFWFQE